MAMGKKIGKCLMKISNILEFILKYLKFDELQVFVKLLTMRTRNNKNLTDILAVHKYNNV